MSDSDRERRERRQRRPRGKSASSQTIRSDETSDTSRYTRLLENRLRAVELLPKDGRPIVAKQTRHVNNHQHAITFRQQFIEQLVENFQEIDRRLTADHRKQAEKKDKRTACILRRVEEVHQKKVRELELLNNRDSVRGILEEYLKNSTPQIELSRIVQLEKDLRTLKQKHRALVKRVNKNGRTCDQNKHEHDDEINGMKKQFEDYRKEIDEYRRQITKIIADLERKLENLNKIQEEHGISIKDLSLQRETLNKLSLQIEQIINARRSDLNKLDQFTKRLGDITDLLTQVREGLHPLSRIPFLEREIEEIRNLLIKPNVVEDLESRVRQIEKKFVRYNDDFGVMNGRLTSLESAYQTLKDRIDYIKDYDLGKIGDHLQSIDKDLVAKTSQISEVNTLARNAADQINELRRFLDNIMGKFSDLDNLIKQIGNIMSRIHDLETKSNDPRIFDLENDSRILDEQNRMRSALNDLANKLEQLVAPANDLERRVNNLERSKIINNKPNQSNTYDPNQSDNHDPNQPDTDDPNEKDFEDYFQRIKKEIIEPVLNTMKDLNEQIKEAKILINDLKTRLNQSLNKQQQSPSIIHTDVSSKRKLIPYVESLRPVDLLDDIWK